jgi:hypothetical protein
VRACVWLSTSTRICVKLNQMVHSSRWRSVFTLFNVAHLPHYRSFVGPSVGPSVCPSMGPSADVGLSHSRDISALFRHRRPASSCCPSLTVCAQYCLQLLRCLLSPFGPLKCWRMCRFLSVETSPVIYRTQQLPVQKTCSFNSQLPASHCLQQDKYWEFSGFCREADENCDLMSFTQWVVAIACRRFGTTYRSHL